MPHLCFEAFSSLALAIQKIVEDHLVNGQVNPYFDVNKGLAVGSATTDDGMIEELVYVIHTYWIAMLELIRTIINLQNFAKVVGSDSAMRNRMKNKFSTIRSIMTKMKGIPINSSVLEYMLKQNVYLASHSVETGHCIDIPYWLPVQDNYAYLSDLSGLDNTLFVTDFPVRKLPDLDTLLTSDMSDENVIDEDSSYGALARKLQDEFNQALAFMKANFQNNANEKKNIIHQNNALLNKLIEWNVLTGNMLDFNLFSMQMNKEVKVVNRFEYYSNLPGYLGAPGPIIKSPQINGTASDTGILGLPDSSGGDGTLYYLKDLDTHYNAFTAYGADPATLISELQADHRIPYGAILLSAAQTSTFLTTGELPAMGSDLAGGSEVYKTANLDIQEGAEVAAPDGVGDWVDHVGFKPKLTGLAEIFGGSYLYESKPGVFFNEMENLSQYVAMSNDAINLGILQPFWLVTPVKDPFDPYFWGSFPLLSKEDVTQPGSWLKWLVNNVSGITHDEVAAGDTMNGSSAYAEDSNYLDPDVSSPMADGYDLIGPFIGDALDLVPDEHFIRGNLACINMFPYDNPIVYKLPVRPFVNNTDDGLAGKIDDAVNDVGATISGVTYGVESASLNVANVNDASGFTIPQVPHALAKRDYTSDRVSVIGRTPVKIVEGYHLYNRSTPQVFEGNMFSELLGKLSPVPASSAVTIALSLQQFLDIKENSMGSGGASLKPFGERSFQSSKYRRNYRDDSRGSSEFKASDSSFSSNRKRRRKGKKPYDARKKFDDKSESSYASNQSNVTDTRDKDYKSKSFGDKTSADELDFAKTDSDSK